jgi:hypothetical protein
MASREEGHRDRDLGRRRARHRARGGDDIQTPRANGTRVATGAGSVACLLAVAAVPIARGDETFQEFDVRVGAVAIVALVAAVVQGWSWLVPAAIALAGGSYALELALDDAPLDVPAPVVAVGLLLAAELAYWSLDERSCVPGDPGQGLRRAALVALGGVSALVVASALLTLVDEIRGRGLALDLVGAVAAVAVVVTVLATARGQSSSGA